MAGLATAQPGDAVVGATVLVRRAAIRGVLAVAVLSLLCNLAALTVPLFNMQVFNRVLATRDVATLEVLMVGAGLCILVFIVLDFVRALALEALATSVARRLALPLLRAVAAGKRDGGAAAEALADLEQLRSFLASTACVAPFDALWTPVMLLALLFQHWGFAALAVACCTVLVVANVVSDAVTRSQMLAANTATAQAIRRAADAVGAAEVVLASGMLPTLSRRWEQGQQRAAALAHRALLRAKAAAAATSALRMSMTGAMVGLGIVLALSGSASGGAMVASNMILARLLMPFQQIASTRRRWIDAMASWQRIRSALERTEPARYAHAMPSPSPRLVVERLVYLAPDADRPLLRGLSFTVEPGEQLGIIGPSSSGKTTLVRALLGMITPTAGGVYLDGTSTALWEREDFARHTGYVPQGLGLLEASVAHNIARSWPPDMAAVLAAAKRAGVHRVIANLPRGYATAVAGATLSSGQRQRVALARALYAPSSGPGPRLLVLDEPSAFLDAAGEAELVATLAQLRADGVTVLLVTHRPALLATVDKVLVLQEGAVAQFGPRDEVLQAIAEPRIRRVPAAAREAAS